MNPALRLPVGIESFERMRREDYYYIDKTKLIEQLLNAGGMVSLFTRPCRFGKTLNMSMLRCFFEVGTDPALFDDLEISKNRRLCDAYLGKFPVIFISLKDVDGLDFENACEPCCAGKCGVWAFWRTAGAYRKARRAHSGVFLRSRTRGRICRTA